MKQTSMRGYRAPRAFRAPGMKLKNIALISASKLHSLVKWQKLAQRLPSGETLLVLQEHNTSLQAVGARICLSLQERGRHSTVLKINSHGGA